MTRITETRLNRLFEQTEIRTNIKGFRTILIKKTIKKSSPIPAENRLEVPCRWCRNPMYIARGQIVNYHGICRKNRNKR